MPCSTISAWNASSERHSAMALSSGVPMVTGGSYSTPDAGGNIRGSMDAEARYRTAMRQCDFLASEIFAERARTDAVQARAAQLEARLADVEARADALEHRLRFATETIANMERSRFWKVRRIWARVAAR